MPRRRKRPNSETNRSSNVTSIAPTGRGYGERAEFEQAASQISPEADTERIMRAIQNFNPGRAGGLTRSTERPDEPATAGLRSGPGPGPSPPPDFDRRSAQQVTAMRLAKYLPALELMSMQPGASVAARQFVRRIRANIPAGTPRLQQGPRGSDDGLLDGRDLASPEEIRARELASRAPSEGYRADRQGGKRTDDEGLGDVVGSGRSANKPLPRGRPSPY